MYNTAQKMKFAIENFFSKCDQIRSKTAYFVTLLNKSLMQNLIFFKQYKDLLFPSQLIQLTSRQL